MEQKPFTIVTEIEPDRVDELKKYLKPIGENIKNNSVISFNEYENLHYCCFLVIDADANSNYSAGAATAVLIFEGNIDGEVESFFRQLLAKNGEFIRRVYKYCDGYPDNDDDSTLIKYILNHDKGANAFYVAHPGRTLTHVRNEHKLRNEIEAFIERERDELIDKPLPQIRESILAFVKNTPELASINNALPKPVLVKLGPWIFNGLLIGLAVIGIALLAAAFGCFGGALGKTIGWGSIALIVLYVVWLRWRESRDVQDELVWNPDHLEIIQENEDRQLQNHLTSVTFIKSGWLRLTTLRVILFVTNIAARLVATQGNLSGIVTIHFARWFIIDSGKSGRKRLIFFSNYDGSWENYLGEFIDQASVGLTAIWSNTELGKDRGFPDTKWLALSGGSRDEQRFKAYARNSQRRELIWYSAYTRLSVKNIGNNLMIRDGLFVTDQDIAAWLKRF